MLVSTFGTRQRKRTPLNNQRRCISVLGRDAMVGSGVPGFLRVLQFYIVFQDGKWSATSESSSIAEARRELAEYFEFHNQGRRHQGLDDRIPAEVY
jgi:hypothetical protein